MAPAPHNLKVGDRCWLLVSGEDKDKANVHEADVTAIDDKGQLTVRRPAWRDQLSDPMEPVGFAEIEVAGLSNMEGVFTDRVVVKGEGNGKACLCQKDPQFKHGGYNDMVEMCRLNNAELAYNLKIRAVEKEPYCRCGVTLVAINLYEPRSSYAPGGSNHHLYSDETMERYVKQRDQDDPGVKPHPWSLASHCYKQVFQGATDQSIVITGESGAGKTYTTKLVLDFLAEVGKDPEAGGPVEGAPGMRHEKITDLMLSATPILEGFGNANMPRNPDSSRFGKLYTLLTLY